MQAGILFFTLVSPKASSGTGWCGAKCSMSLSLSLHRHEMGTIHIQRSLGSEARARAHGACPVRSLPTQSSSASRARGRGGGQARLVPLAARSESKARGYTLSAPAVGGGIAVGFESSPQSGGPHSSHLPPRHLTKEMYTAFLLAKAHQCIFILL